VTPTLVGNFVTEEGEFGCFADTFCRVDNDAVCLEKVEGVSEVVLMLFEGLGENEVSSRYAKQKSSPRRMSSIKR
jgi:hypothetical protein